MNPRIRSFSLFVIICLLFVPFMRAQENPLNDPDLKEMLKEAQEMQKKASELQKNPTSAVGGKKLAEMEAMAKQEAARQEEHAKSNTKRRDRSYYRIGHRLPRNSRLPRRQQEKS
jgi:hypothetical protein